MAKVKVKALQTLNGDYGTAQPGDIIELDEKAATRLAKAGVVEMKGVEVESDTPAPKGPSVTANTAPKHMDSDKTVEKKKK